MNRIRRWIVARRLIVTFALVFATGILTLVAGHPTASAGDCSGQSTVLGTNIPSVFPLNPRALQDNPTGFGDASPPQEEDTEGNELCRLFAANDSDALYIGITGNTERSDSLENTVLVFIDTGNNGGTEILNTSGFTGGSNALRLLDIDDKTDGTKLDFAPEYCLAVWNSGGTQFAYLHDLTNPTDAGTLLVEGVDFAVDNSNLAGVNDVPLSDPIFQQENAVSATTGFEFKLSLDDLGIDSSSTVGLQALLVSGSGFISNQSLPPLRATVGSSGGGLACVGSHDPNGDPPNAVDFADNARFPGTQNVQYNCNPVGMAPAGMMDGTNIPNRYTTAGLALATQNNYTCFGNAQPYSPIPTGGAEINQIFARADFSKLYIGVTGNIPFFGGNNDTLMIFVDIGPGDGTQTLFTANFEGGSGALQGMSQGAAGGFTFDNGFEPEFCIMYWRAGGQHNARIMSCVFDEHIDGLEFSPSADRHTNAAVNVFSADLGNIEGINDIAGDDPIRQESFAPTAISGIQFSVRLADLGIDTSGGSADFKMSACIVSGSGFVSNQFLPPLNPTNLTPEMDSASFSDSPLPLAIPDDEETAATDTRAVSMPTIDRITDVNVSVSITHPDVSQLDVKIRHNDSGREVTLVAPGDRAGANLTITFDSEGAPAVQPSGSLLSFNGIDPNGGWTLTVLDTVSGDSGTLNSWGIAVTEYTGGNVSCLGQFDAVDNPINLATDPRTPGNQFFDLSLPASPANRPTSYTGLGIPAAFGNTPLAGGTQNNYTCFGNATEAAVVNLPGSELNQIRIRNTSDRLRIGLTGNLEGNGNAVVLLLDTNPSTGPSTLPVLSSPPDAAQGLDGLTLDAGFQPDYAVVVQRDPTAGVPDNDYNVFLKNINTNFTRSIGRLTRNAPTGELAEAIPNQNGSELNQLFLQNDADRVYIGITGNLEANGNTWIIFLQTTPTGSGTNILNTNHVGFPTALRNINADRMDIGFQPDYAIVMHRSGGFYNAQLVDLLDIPPGVTVTELTFSSTIGDNVYFGDNTNASGVNSNAAQDDDMGSPPSQQILNAQTATRGVQFAIARSSLVHDGGPPLNNGDTIKIGALLASNTGFWSNQTLPGLGGGKANLGAPPPPGRPTTFIDLSAESIAPGNQFTSYVLSGSFSSPSSFNGANIPAAMGTAIATQNNYTGFGNATLVNPGNANCTQVAFNNENILGVTGSSATPAQAESATSGLHFDIAFQDIGLTPVDPISGPFVPVKVMAVITGRFGYFSNQFLPPLMRTPPASNLGDIPANWTGDLSDSEIAPGDQFLTYTLVPYCGELAADINGDDFVDPNDINAFVGVLLGINTNPCDVQKSDLNNDGLRNGLDIQNFIEAYFDDYLEP